MHSFSPLFLLLLLLEPPGLGAQLFTPTVPRVTLSNGVSMPLVLLGTPSCRVGDEACVNGTAEEVVNALRIGFPGVDTADHYHQQVNGYVTAIWWLCNRYMVDM